MTVSQPLAASARHGIDVAVDQLLAALEDPWPLARLAAVAGYSPYHFHRLFVRAMGETPQRFVARARAERAAALLHADPALTLTEAAAAVGFATPSQLSRAFRARFGMPPSDWDRVGPLHERAQNPALADLPLLGAEDTAGGSAAVSVRQLPGFGFAYRRILDPYGSSRLLDAWGELASWAGGRAGSGPAGHRLVGMSWDDPDVVPAASCRYDLGVTVDVRGPAPPASTVRWVPSGRVAALRVRGDLAAVDAAWQALYRSWLPASAYVRASMPAMEWFHADPAPSGWTQWDLDCLVPVLPHRKIRQASSLRGRRRSG